LFFIVLSGCAGTSGGLHASAYDKWQVQKTIDRATRNTQCALLSPAKNYASGIGLDTVYIKVAQDGIVWLETRHDPFNKRATPYMGIKVDENPPVLGPVRTSNQRVLRFSPQDSERLLQQLAEGDLVKIQVSLHPRQEMITGRYSLEGFEDALLKYRVCEVMSAEAQSAR
jgi:hypothetical protein